MTIFKYTVTLNIETEEGPVALEQALRGALDGIAATPYLDYSDLVIEPDGPEYDFLLNDQSTILVLTAQTDEARAWIEENVSMEGYQPDLPNRVYMEHRFVDAILDGIDADGLTVDAIEQALAGAV